jgi:hypothetical protein
MKITATEAIALITVLILFEITIWAVLGFLIWNWNIATWSEGCRLGFVMASIIMPAAILVVVGEVLAERKFND